MDEFQSTIVSECLSGLGRDLLQEIITHGEVKAFDADEYVIKQGQLLKHLPIVLEGMVKVFSEEDDYQFLLYYIHPGATCIFSFAHFFGEKKMAFSGTAEKASSVLLIPVHKAREWMLKYPVFSGMIVKEYERHYNDLLETTKQILCYNLEDRILQYLQTKASITGNTLLAISHATVATDLATSREAISRVMKKLERDHKVLQSGRKIQLL
ncbi:Crp/Fnr family transcriptional regulator [Chitinophaga sp. S165]|uniref:Crp/Fnr family transcriptional regulator n=1 Tax=Chitinophaga sp. S165 TaxID=2135462 RepID=UPI000D7179E1|nr:Crp/Fnr family transcriptional regulator [Chitinophaga sp. S165]PWV49146.1 CRP/FNR family transcriptional regulator [Chitinophaga sp. S165]